uniref:Uncharacterized protein n=1 Tax=Clastoptera arizonana TaxID=38151 RepID=A0A1B6EH50_9HEMI
MAKKPVNHNTNPQNTIETEALPSLKKNKVVNKILRAGKEERLKIIESDIIKNYAFWLDMRKGLMNDYFTNEKNEGEFVNGTEKIFGKHKFKNHQLSKNKNTEGLNGVKLKKKSINNTSKRPFPKTLEGLEKEFEELKGMTFILLIKVIDIKHYII